MRQHMGRGLAIALTTALAVGVIPASAVAESGGRAGLSLPTPGQPRAVPVKPVKSGGTAFPDAAALHPWKGAPRVSRPASGSTDIPLDAAPGTGPVSVSTTPVGPLAQAGVRASRSTLVDPAPKAGAKVKVTVADRTATRRAGVQGVLLSVDRAVAQSTTDTLRVSVDYDGFRGAFGGDWAARLRFAELPSCVLSTPQRPECRSQRPLDSVNDTETGEVSAEIPSGPTTVPRTDAAKASSASASGAMVLAVTADPSGPTGDFKATPLDASASWSAGGSTGALSWNHPLEIPAVPGGLVPGVELGYNSQAVDGRTGASNNQASWIGDGWSYEPGFIERRYKSCEQDKANGTNTTKRFDQCWYSDNAVLHLGGKSTELVYEKDKGWHPEADSGEKVEKLTGAVNGDEGTDDVDGKGEHWKVTTTDGTQYFFGRNRLPGWTDNGTITPEDDSPVTAPTPPGASP
ncbi:hypothetical protein [Streptomyces sp. NPDC093089]|uniref:hypothetical protein n=1 Tax=Streptomyces sp. NPDC093089 TaxID=3366024 RepID=UPI003822732B